LAFNSLSTQIISGSEKNIITVRNIQGENKNALIYDVILKFMKNLLVKFHQAPISFIQPTDHEAYNLSVSEDCVIHIWNLNEPRYSLTFKSQSGLPKQIAVSMGLGLLVYSTMQENLLTVMNLNSQQTSLKLQVLKFSGFYQP